MRRTPSFDEIFSKEGLDACFERIVNARFDVYTATSAMAPGVDRLDLAAFERQRDQHLATASWRSIAGKYQFGPFLEHQIDKPGGTKKRVVSVGRIRDVVVQSALARCLYDAIDVQLGPEVFAYRRGHSAHGAARSVHRHLKLGRVHVFDADLKEFFDSLDHDLLRQLVFALDVDQRARDLTWRYIRADRVPADVAASAGPRQSLRKLAQRRTRGVPQGGAISGLLANLYLASMDATIRAAGGQIVRYADDFVIMCASEAECSRMGQAVRAALLQLRLSLHEEKTVPHRLASETGVDFVGFHITERRVSVRDRNIQRFKDRIGEVLAEFSARKGRTPGGHLVALCGAIRPKIRGPEGMHMDTLIKRRLATHRHRRCWAGFFRIVSHEGQLRRLDRWLRTEISRHIWQLFRRKVCLADMQRAGLQSLVRQVWRARTPARGGGPGLARTAAAASLMPGVRSEAG